MRYLSAILFCTLISCAGKDQGFAELEENVRGNYVTYTHCDTISEMRIINGDTIYRPFCLSLRLFEDGSCESHYQNFECFANLPDYCGKWSRHMSSIRCTEEYVLLNAYDVNEKRMMMKVDDRPDLLFQSEGDTLFMENKDYKLSLRKI